MRHQDCRTSAQVPTLTFCIDIKLNARVSLRRHRKPLRLCPELTKTNHCDEARIRLDQNVTLKTPTKVRDRIGQMAKKPLSLRYAEVVKLRQAIQRALAES